HHKEDVMYRVNCQSCVVANELRRRGFDVEAFGNPDKEGYASSALALDVFAAWTDKDGQRVQPVRVRRGVKYRDIDRRGNVRTTYESDKELQARILDTMKEPGRYIVRWSWDKKTTGHVITAERTEDGAFRFYDPQSGKTGFNWQMKQVDTAGRGFSILKIDGLYPNTAIASEVVKKTGSDSRQKEMSEAARKEFERLGVLKKKESTMASELTLTKKSIRKSERFPIQEEAELPNLITGKLRKNSFSRRKLIDHCRSIEEIEASEFIWNHPSILKYIERQELGAVKDLGNPTHAANVEAKKKRGVTEYVIYTFNNGKKNWTVKLENIDGNNEQFYAIVKSRSS
ncbi:MAG: toxin glutamine deamidase domain-containing protein, partial [Bacteroidales bacterium]|nr:toxin glutamine deamidase domain-containing protein [Bacteroidales bacterium]